jgi:hypothetical protein
MTCEKIQYEQSAQGYVLGGGRWVHPDQPNRRAEKPNLVKTLAEMTRLLHICWPLSAERMSVWSPSSSLGRKAVSPAAVPGPCLLDFPCVLRLGLSLRWNPMLPRIGTCAIRLHAPVRTVRARARAYNYKTSKIARERDPWRNHELSRQSHASRQK